MKNVEFGEAFGLEEAAGVAGVSERNLLRMAGKGELSVWFWCRGSEFFDQNDTIIWLDGWLRVPAGTTRLFTEYEAVRVTVFENQDGDCYYPAVDTNPVVAVMVADRYTPRYFGQSEAVPTDPTFERGYWTLEKRDLFFVPSEIEAIAERQTDFDTKKDSGRTRKSSGLLYSGEEAGNMELIHAMVRLATKNEFLSFWSFWSDQPKINQGVVKDKISEILTAGDGDGDGENVGRKGSTLNHRFAEANKLVDGREPLQEKINDEERLDRYIIGLLIKIFTNPQKKFTVTTRPGLIEEIYKESDKLLTCKDIERRLDAARKFRPKGNPKKK